jgi:spermidine synthase
LTTHIAHQRDHYFAKTGWRATASGDSSSVRHNAVFWLTTALILEIATWLWLGHSSVAKYVSQAMGAPTTLGALVVLPFSLAWLLLLVTGQWSRPFALVTVFAFLVSFAGLMLRTRFSYPDVDLWNPIVVARAAVVPTLVSIAYLLWRNSRKQDMENGKNFVMIAVVAAAVSLCFSDLAQLTALLSPRTVDGAMLRLDTWFGFSDVRASSSVVNQYTERLAVSRFAEAMLPYAALVVWVIAVDRGLIEPARAGRLLKVVFITTLVCVVLLPASGPHAVFGSQAVLMTDEASLYAWMTMPPFGPRFASLLPVAVAQLVLVKLSLSQRSYGIFAASGSLLLLQCIVSIVLGKHYLVSFACSISVSAIAMAVVWRDQSQIRFARTRWTLVLTCLSIGVYATAFRVLFISPDALVNVQLAAIAVAACSGAVYLYLFSMRRTSFAAEALSRDMTTQPDPRAMEASADKSILTVRARPLLVLFFLSGFAGLVYEVVFSKALALTFGSTALAQYTVLATYMGGMAIGAWLGGVFAAKTKSPMRIYALCELCIGVYALFTPLIFLLVQWIYTSLGQGVAPDTQYLTVLRVCLGVIALLIPTVLMGVTFPVAIRHVRNVGVDTNESIAGLYTMNVVGAATGSLLAGYLLLPLLGKFASTYLAALIGLAVGIYVLLVYGKNDLESHVATTTKETILPKKLVVMSSRPSTLTATSAISVLAVGGAITLALEVIYIHLLAVVAGNSVYAFALMLFAFLSGLGLGAEIERRFLSKRLTSIQVLVVAELGLACVIALTTHVWDAIPAYFAAYGTYLPELSFAARELVRSIVCLFAMVPAALFIGMAYPAAMEIASLALSNEPNRGLGRAAAINTFGNISGVFLGGFVLLPAFGSLFSLKLLAVVATGLGVIALVAELRVRRSAYFATSSAALLGLVGFAILTIVCTPRAFDIPALTSGANVYFTANRWGDTVEHRESVHGGLTSVSRLPDGTYVLLTNGKFQGNNAEGGEMVAQVGIAVAPLLHTARRGDALVIGYGTGVTTRTLAEAQFARVDVAEISRDIVVLADKYFSNVNDQVLKRANVQLHIADGRNFLLTQPRNYDLISMEVSSIWFAGAANLYNREFYQLVRNRLRAEGVLQQWIQLHHITPRDLTVALSSIHAEFKYVWLYVVSGQGVIVASNSENAKPTENQLRQMQLSADTERFLTRYRSSPEQVARSRVLEPLDVDQIVRQLKQSGTYYESTDNNLYLEYSTPKGNAQGGAIRIDANIEALKALAIPIAP